MHNIKASYRALLTSACSCFPIIPQLKTYHNEIYYCATKDKFMAPLAGQLKASSTITQDKTL